MADRASCLTMSWQLARSGRRPTSSCMTARGWPRSGGGWLAIYFTGMTLAEAESGEEPPVEWVTPALTTKRRAPGAVKRPWCENLAATLGLRRVWVKHINNPAASLRIAIDGVVEPL